MKRLCLVLSVCFSACSSPTLQCPDGQSDCSGTCRDLTSDGANCGACGTTCEAGKVCASGACSLVCSPGTVNCSGTCRDTQVDGSNCGACGVHCAAGEVCSSGACAVTCQAGLVDCGGKCVDPNTDRGFCGATADCAGAHKGATCAAGQVCSAGSCAVSCQVGLVNCGGKCIDPVNDRSNCGASGTCAGANAGATCGSGQVCSTGVCAVSCPTGQLNCGGKCVDPGTDRTFCGATTDCAGANVGVACDAGQVCSGGTCAVSCQAGLLKCGTSCVNPMTDRTHCGATMDCAAANAGAVCGLGEVCQAGACVVSCQAGQVLCGTTCIDPDTSRTHCGATADCVGANQGASCAAGQVCNMGTCAVSCQAGFLNCGGTCIDPQTSRTHCGATADCSGATAGVSCGTTSVCTAGVCSQVCANGQTFCAGACTDTQTDANNCSVCGNVCPAGTPNCSHGTCIALLTFSGVQNDLPIASLTGWTQCFAETYGTSGSNLTSLLTACDKPLLMMACRATGGSTLQVAAMGPRADVTFDTGDGNNVTHDANGVSWYFSTSYSWGFAPAGDPVSRNSCDIEASPNNGNVGVDGNQRICWHTGSGELNGGWRCGSDTSLNGSSAFERVIYQAD